MLTEMDGVESRQEVFLMAATNRPDIIDSAVLRPGRLDKILYVGLPTASDRVDILHAITKVFIYVYTFYICIYKIYKENFTVLNDLYFLFYVFLCATYCRMEQNQNLLVMLI